jgi:hypothetical protein
MTRQKQIERYKREAEACCIASQNPNLTQKQRLGAIQGEVDWLVAQEMTIASDLLEQHIQTLVDDNARWQTLIADEIIWELAYAPSIGHPARLSGQKEAVRHATWFVSAVVNFRFFNLKVYALTDVQRAVAVNCCQIRIDDTWLRMGRIL